MRINKQILRVLTCGVLLGTTMFAFAADVKPDACSTFGSNPDWAHSEDCKKCGEMQNAPHYYCECHAAGHLHYGMDTIITDTTWLKAPLTEVIEKGIMAYWFSENGIGVEFYVNCIQIAPYKLAYISANKSYGMDSKELQAIVDKNNLGTIVKNFDAYFRFYPLNGKPGRVIGLEYNQGFHSTCDDLFPVYYNMLYPFSYTDNVYELRPQDMNRDFFVQWKQTRNKNKDTSADMAITWGECMGDTVGSAYLFDSTKVYFPDRHLLDSARAADKSLFFHFKSTGMGTLTFVSPVHWERDSLEYELCEGLSVTLKDTVLTETTVYADTTWVVGDTCKLTIHDVTVIPPTPIDTIIYLKKEDLPHRFNGWKRLNAFGNYTIMDNSVEGECAKLYHLQLIEDVTSNVARIDANFALLAQTYIPAGKAMQVAIPQGGQLQVVDMLGRVLYAQAVGKGEHTLQLSEMGHYIVRLITPDQVITQRVQVL